MVRNHRVVHSLTLLLALKQHTIMKLSPHFTLEELCQSDTAKARGIKNDPNAEQAACLALLATHVLEPAREEYGAPMRITSGFRSTKLNRAVGGKSNSQHLRGQAADIVCDNLDALFIILDAQKNYDQLLYESNASGTRWIHVSFNPDGNRCISNPHYKV